MSLLIDLIRGVALTLALGIAIILGEDLFGKHRLAAPMFFLAIAGSLFAGVAVIARRQRDHIVPIGAIFVVLMFGVLVYLAFLVAWHRGRVEF